MELVTGVGAIGVLGVLFAYAWRLIRRSDAQRDDYTRALEYDRDFWRARALGLPEPIRPDDVPATKEEP